MTRYGISIIGAGRLGRALGRRLRENGWKIHSVVTRSVTTARRSVRSIGAGQPSGAISAAVFAAPAPVLLVAVPDSEIPSVVAQLASAGAEDLRGSVILHTSGALGSEVLEPLHSVGAAIGSLHPLQSFSGVGIPELEGRLFAMEGDSKALRIVRIMVRALRGQVVVLDCAAKPAYHAAASMAAGQVLTLLEAAVQLFQSLGIDRREARRALLPLTRQVLENQERLGPRAAWTGPLARNDFGVIAAHEAALLSMPAEYLQAYRALNRLAARVLARDPGGVLAALQKVSETETHNSCAKGASA